MGPSPNVLRFGNCLLSVNRDEQRAPYMTKESLLGPLCAYEIQNCEFFLFEHFLFISKILD